MGMGGVSSLGDEMFRNQVETVSVPHRKRTRCHGAVHSPLVLPYESSQLREGKSAWFQCVSLSVSLTQPPPSPPLHPLRPQPAVFLGGRLGRASNCSFTP